eukprot:1153690-Pelagomonas_calceolata.AAC.3
MNKRPTKAHEGTVSCHAKKGHQLERGGMLVIANHTHNIGRPHSIEWTAKQTYGMQADLTKLAGQPSGQTNYVACCVSHFRLCQEGSPFGLFLRKRPEKHQTNSPLGSGAQTLVPAHLNTRARAHTHTHTHTHMQTTSVAYLHSCQQLRRCIRIQQTPTVVIIIALIAAAAAAAIAPIFFATPSPRSRLQVRGVSGDAARASTAEGELRASSSKVWGRAICRLYTTVVPRMAVAAAWLLALLLALLCSPQGQTLWQVSNAFWTVPALPFKL